MTSFHYPNFFDEKLKTVAGYRKVALAEMLEWNARTWVLRATSTSPTRPPFPSPVGSISFDSLLSTHSTSPSASSVDSSSVDSGEPKVPSVLPVFIPLYEGKGKHVWPRGVYMIDTVVWFSADGLSDGLTTPPQRYTQRGTFQSIFGVPFVRATYRANRSAWANAKNTSLLLARECAGHTLGDLWTRYLAARRDTLGQTRSLLSRSGPYCSVATRCHSLE
ncbi:hypothetical protein BDR05DRAFT_1005876 [Suillus weaverae]|nr:hypothetical protein BDR05DRAFT_1005876 [Suillus weaverae]